MSPCKQKNFLFAFGFFFLCVMTIMSIKLSERVAFTEALRSDTPMYVDPTLTGSTLRSVPPPPDKASSNSEVKRQAVETQAAPVKEGAPAISTDPEKVDTPLLSDEKEPAPVSNSTFMERLNRLLPPTCSSLLEEHKSTTPCVSEQEDRRLFPDDIERIEREIMAFNIPRPVIIDFWDYEYLSLIHWRWKFVVDGRRPPDQQQCPRCTVRHTTTNAGMTATSKDELNAIPADIKIHDGCPHGMEDNFKHHEHQITVGGCGESQLGTGSGFANSGRHQFDHDTSFEDRGKHFHRTYAHLHLSPPEPKYAGLTELYSVTDMARALLRDPPKHRLGDDRGEQAMFTHSNCWGDRGNLVSAVIESDLVGVARYGQCYHNRDGQEFQPPSFYFGDNEGTRDSTKTILSSLHKFTFSLENTFSRDYFTEKRYQALLGCSVPIVWDNDNSLDFLPDPDAALVVNHKVRDGRLVAEQIRDMAANATRYNEFFAWKQRGLRASFVRKLFLSTDFVTCRMCEYTALHYPSSKTRDQ